MNTGETGITLAGSVNLISAGSAPNTAALATAVNTPVLTAIPTSAGTLTFDVRGAPTPAAVDVLYLNNSAAPRAGYRAVVVMPWIDADVDRRHGGQLVAGQLSEELARI